MLPSDRALRPPRARRPAIDRDGDYRARRCRVGDALSPRTCARRRDAVALVDGERALSFAEWERLVERAALGLLALGVGRGDVVAYQLPNWWEAAVLFLAAARVGAVVNPVLPMFRERELRFILRQSGAAVLVDPGRLPRLRPPAAGRAACAPSCRRCARCWWRAPQRRRRCARSTPSWPRRGSAPRRPPIASSPRRSRRAAHAHVHLRHHRRSEGRAAHARHADRRGAEPGAHPRARPPPTAR